MDKAVRATWPEQSREAKTPRRDWKDTLTAATDLALVGFGVVVAALGVITAGAAVATGSFAIQHWITERSYPTFGQLWRQFLRWLLPGALGTAGLAGAGVLLSINLTLIAQGKVPGGSIALAVTWALLLWLLLTALLTVVQLGRHPADGWLAALRWAGRAATTTPHRAVVALLVAGLAGLLALMVPVTFPLLVAYGLFAVHVVVGKLFPEESEVANPDLADEVVTE